MGWQYRRIQKLSTEEDGVDGAGVKRGQVGIWACSHGEFEGRYGGRDELVPGEEGRDDIPYASDAGSPVRVFCHLGMGHRKQDETGAA